MDQWITEYAYAKINLYLHLTGRREDGYHTLVSVMQSVDLHDILTLSCPGGGEGKIELHCDTPGLSTGEDNLVCRAARMFMDRYGKRNLRIRLEKQIPIAAGLAGGSSDAAATLRALNRLYGYPATEDDLLCMSVRLGADVPFCLCGGTALAEGIGEHLTVLPPAPPVTVLIACGGAGVSTPLAYRALDEMYKGFSEPVLPDRQLQPLLSAIARGDAPGMSGTVFNLFEKAVLPHHSEATESRNLMISGGALCAMLSGSGPSVFGIFTEKAKADAVAGQIRKNGWFAYVGGFAERKGIFEK